MQMTDFLSLLGGLALFLYGMQMMSSGLEAAAGSRMKQILERLTANRFLGVLAVSYTHLARPLDQGHRPAGVRRATPGPGVAGGALSRPV